jgi:hypothetical protein
VTLDVPPVRAAGDPNHIADHNLISSGLTALDAALAAKADSSVLVSGLAAKADDAVAVHGYTSFVSGKYYGPAFHNVATFAQGNGALNMTPLWVPVACTLDRIGIECTAAAAGSAVRLGIYLNGAGDKPSARLLDAGTVDTSSTTGVKLITISQAVPAGWIWLVGVNQTTGTNPTMRVVLGGLVPIVASTMQGAGLNQYYRSGISGALPDPITVEDAANNGYRIMVRAA